MSKIILALSAFVFSVILFLIIFQFINPVGFDTKKTSLEFNLESELNEKTPCLLECQKKHVHLDASHQTCIHHCNHDKDLNSSILDGIAMYAYLTDDKKSPDSVIQVIYFLIWLALWMQSTLFFFTLFKVQLNFLKKYYFHMVDTSLNSPPILGVMGTIYSFAIYTTELNDQTDLIEGFKNSFFDAAFTTIIAGFIYLINLYFKIVILQDKNAQ